LAEVAGRTRIDSTVALAVALVVGYHAVKLMRRALGDICASPAGGKIARP
jgi:hypothetical protein